MNVREHVAVLDRLPKNVQESPLDSPLPPSPSFPIRSLYISLMLRTVGCAEFFEEAHIQGLNTFQCVVQFNFVRNTSSVIAINHHSV